MAACMRRNFRMQEKCSASLQEVRACLTISFAWLEKSPVSLRTFFQRSIPQHPSLAKPGSGLLFSPATCTKKKAGTLFPCATWTKKKAGTLFPSGTCLHRQSSMRFPCSWCILRQSCTRPQHSCRSNEHPCAIPSVDDNRTMQRPTGAGREAGTNRSEIAMRPCYEAVVSQAETRRKNPGRRSRGLSSVVTSMGVISTIWSVAGC